jgi:hypothetical protein
MFIISPPGAWYDAPTISQSFMEVNLLENIPNEKATRGVPKFFGWL